MVFFDASGRRWRRIKHFSLALAVMVVLPVAALVAGSLGYHPHWGWLPIIQRPGVTYVQNSGQQTATAPAKAAKPAAKPAPHHVAAGTRVYRGSTVAAAQPAAAINFASPQPQPSPSPAMKGNGNAYGLGSGNPTKNDFGQSHRK